MQQQRTRSAIDHRLATNHASEMKSTIRLAFNGSQNGNYLPLVRLSATFCTWFKIVLQQRIKFLTNNLRFY